MPAPDFTDAERATLARFDAAETPPEILLAHVEALADDYAFLGATLHHVPVQETYATVAAELRAAIQASR